MPTNNRMLFPSCNFTLTHAIRHKREEEEESSVDGKRKGIMKYKRTSHSSKLKSSIPYRFVVDSSQMTDFKQTN
jgi:hypothetical protein